MAVHTNGRKARVLKEMTSDLRETRVPAHRSEKLWWSGQMHRGRARKTCPQLWVSVHDLQQRESCKAEDTVRRRFITALANRSAKQDRV